MKNGYKLEAKKNMMIGRKIQSLRHERGRETGAVCAIVCVEVRLNGMQQTEELQRH